MDAVIGQDDMGATHVDGAEDVLVVDTIDLLPDYDDDEITLVIPSRPPPAPADSHA
jgi:hypothetical protein